MAASTSQKKILTIPNLLSFFRLCLIPLILWFYCVKEDALWATLLLVLSGLTDIVDGWIARHFNMVSDFGKAFDPVADKLTQIAMLFCLLTRFRLMLLPLCLLIVKELFAAVTGLMTIKKTGNVMGADWHGKVATVLLYGMIGLHFIWYRIPAAVSNVTILLSTTMLLISAFLYGRRNLKVLMEKNDV